MPERSPTPAAEAREVTRQATKQNAAFTAEVDRSSREVDAAERYARRGSRATLALAVLASAGALFGLAGVLRTGRAGWVALGTGVAALLL